MKKNELTVKVDLELPKEVITQILNKGLSRFEEAKYLILAHYYYHQNYIVGVKDMNQFLGVKDSKGKEMRLNLNHWNIITPISSSKIKRNNKGQFFKKGYDIYHPSIESELIQYTIISDDARALIGKYSGQLLDALDVVAEKATVNDIKKYNRIKEEFRIQNVKKEVSADCLSIVNKTIQQDKEVIEIHKPEVLTIVSDKVGISTAYDTYIDLMLSKGVTAYDDLLTAVKGRYIIPVMVEGIKNKIEQDITVAVQQRF